MTSVSQLLRGRGGLRSGLNKIGFGVAVAGVILVANAATAILVSRLVGAAGRGAFAQVVVFGTVTATLASFGIPEAAASTPKELGQTAWGPQIVTSFVVGVGWALLLAPVAWIIALSESIRWPLLLMAILLPVRSAGLTAIFVVLAQGKVILHQILITGIPVLTLLGIVIAVAVGYTSSVTLAWVAVVGATVPSLATLALCGSIGVRLPDQSTFRSTMRFGARSWVSSLSTSLNQRLDQLILSVTIDPALVGVYANAATVASAALVAPTGTGPRLRWAVAKNDQAGVRRWLVAGIGASVGLGLVASGAGYFLFEAIFGSDFSSGRPLTAVLALCAPLLATTRLLAMLITMKGSPGIVAIADLAGLVSGAATLVLLLPVLGLWAAVVGSVIGYSVALLVEAKPARRFVSMAAPAPHLSQESVGVS